MEADRPRSRAEKNKKQNKTENRRLGRGTRRRGPKRRQCGGMQCGAGSGEEWARGCGKGRHRPPHPSTHHRRPLTQWPPGRAGRRTRCSCCRHRCPAPRWSRSRTGSDPPRCTARTAKGQPGRLAPVPEAGALGGGGGLSHLGAPRLSTATASWPRPLPRPRPTPTPLGPAPKGAQPPSGPLLGAASPLWDHLCSPLGTAGRPVCFCPPTHKGRHYPVPASPCSPSMVAPRDPPGPRFAPSVPFPQGPVPVSFSILPCLS